MKWNMVQVSKTCLKTRTKDPRKRPNKPFLYVDISSIDRNFKVITSTPELLGSEAPSRARKEIREGDVLVSTVRPNLNAVAMVPPELDGQIASTGFCVLRPNLSDIEGKYLFYFTTTQDFISILTSKVRGAHYPAVSDGDVKGLDLPLPALSEQRRIIEILDQADALRKKRAEADAKSSRILPAIFFKMFGDPVTNPKGWDIQSLETITKTIHRYPTFYGQEYVEQGVPVVRIGDILPTHVLNPNLKNYVRVPESFSNKFPLTLLKHLDVVMAVRGDTTGKIGLVPEELQGANISPNLIRISPNTTKVKPYYFFSFMLFSKLLIGTFITNTAKKSITAKNLKTLPCPTPPVSLQEKFDEIVKRVLYLRRQTENSYNKLDLLYSTILHRSFSGQLTAKWREAHMKELLDEMEIQAKELNLQEVRL